MPVIVVTVKYESAAAVTVPPAGLRAVSSAKLSTVSLIIGRARDAMISAGTQGHRRAVIRVRLGDQPGRVDRRLPGPGGLAAARPIMIIGCTTDSDAPFQ